MYSYSDVERKIDREIMCERKKSLKSTKAKVKRFTHMFIKQADVLLVNFGESEHILSQGISEKIVIMGITDYDFRVNEKISLSCR